MKKRVNQKTRDALASVATEAPDSTELAKLQSPAIDADVIAIKYSVPVASVAAVVAEVIKHNTETLLAANAENPESAEAEKVLRGQLGMLTETIDTAYYEYMADPTNDNAYSLTALVQAAQNVLKNIKDFCEVEGVIEKVTRIAVEPFTKAIIRVAIEQLGLLKGDIIKLMQPKDHEYVEQKFKDCLRDIGGEYRDEYEKVRELIRKAIAGK